MINIIIKIFFYYSCRKLFWKHLKIFFINPARLIVFIHIYVYIQTYTHTYMQHHYSCSLVVTKWLAVLKVYFHHIELMSLKGNWKMELCEKTEWSKKCKRSLTPSLLSVYSVVSLSVLLFILLLSVALLNSVLLPPILLLCFHTN